MMWYSGSGIHWWGAALMAVGAIAFWALIIWGVWYLVTTVTRDNQRGRTNYNARQILDERLARGEIDAEEYRRLRDLLRGEDPASADGHGLVGSGKA